MNDGLSNGAAVLVTALCISGISDIWLGYWYPKDYDAMTSVCRTEEKYIACPEFNPPIPLAKVRLTKSGIYRSGMDVTCEWKRYRSFTGILPVGPDMNSFVCWP